MAQFKDISGQRFGLLTVKKFVEMSRQGSVWLCVCDCGNEVKIGIGAIQSGNTKSCGCLRLRRVTEALLKDLTGSQFGDWFVIGRDENKNKQHTYWLCRCSCGAVVSVEGKSLRRGDTQKCKVCAGKDLTKARRPFEKALRIVLGGIKNRCRCRGNTSYRNYGGRGIALCDEWNDFESFYEWAIKSGYQPNLTVERVCNDLGYSPGNCRWATFSEQNRNKRSNKIITIDGEAKTLSDWLAEYHRPTATYKTRIKLGWSEIDAIIKPARRRT